MGDLLSNKAIVSEMITESSIDPALPGDSKGSIISGLASLGVRTGFLADAQKLVEQLSAREAQGSTAVNGFALLHPMSPTAHLGNRSFILLGRTPQPILFDAPDGNPVDIFFAVCCQTASSYRQAVTRIFQMILKTELLSQLRGAADRSTMYRSIMACEEMILR